MSVAKVLKIYLYLSLNFQTIKINRCELEAYPLLEFGPLHLKPCRNLVSSHLDIMLFWLQYLKTPVDFNAKTFSIKNQVYTE